MSLNTDTRLEEKKRTDTCPECGGAVQPSPSQAEIVCSECGLVLRESLVSHELKYNVKFATCVEEDNTPNRGSNTGLNERQTATYIGRYNSEMNGLSPRQKRRIKRLKQRNKETASREKREQNTCGKEEIEALCAELELPDSTKSIALQLMKEAGKADFYVGRSREKIGGACVYLAIQNTDALRTLGEIAAYSTEDNKAIFVTARRLQRELDLPVDIKQVTDYLPQIATKLDLNKRTERLVRPLLNELASQGIDSGRSPETFIGGVIYWMSLQNKETKTRSFTDISESLDVAVTAIRQNYSLARDGCMEFFDMPPEKEVKPCDLMGNGIENLESTVSLTLPDDSGSGDVTETTTTCTVSDPSVAD